MTLTEDFKTFGRGLGFHLVGVTSPEPFGQAEIDITRWLGEGHQGEMGWLNAARTRLATRPLELLPEARSLVVVGVSYRTVEPDQAGTLGGRVARYAWGGDYHAVMKQRLLGLASFLAERVGHAVRSRVFVDSGPLVERDAAVRAGLGFRGKNTNLLTPIGSFVFLGALLTDVELDFDQPVAKDCGSCRLCIDACPTNALDQAYHLAAERCIAYLTIEHRGPIDAELRPKLGDWVFGCDICQEVCPYNASTRGRPRGWAEFEPRLGTRLDLQETLALDDQAFSERFRGSPIKRAKRRGLARNAALVLGNQAQTNSPADPVIGHRAQTNSQAAAAVGSARIDPAPEKSALERATDDPDPIVRDAAEWALARLPRAEGATPLPLL